MHEQPFHLEGLKKSVYAQGTEEDILQRILRVVSVTNRFCVDIGASDGQRNSNTALLLREQGWRGVLIEGSAYRFGRLRELNGGENTTLVHARVQPDTIETVLTDAGVPDVIDLLSLDIDGNDYWIWRAIERVRARVVVVEYNPYYEPPKRWVMSFNKDHEWDGSTHYGASLESFAALGRAKGYELVCCDDAGNNAFFVEKSLFPSLGIENNAVQLLYRPAFYKLRFIGQNTFVTGHPYRFGPGEEP